MKFPFHSRFERKNEKRDKAALEIEILLLNMENWLECRLHTVDWYESELADRIRWFFKSFSKKSFLSCFYGRLSLFPGAKAWTHIFAGIKINSEGVERFWAETIMHFVQSIFFALCQLWFLNKLLSQPLKPRHDIES